MACVSILYDLRIYLQPFLGFLYYPSYSPFSPFLLPFYITLLSIYVWYYLLLAPLTCLQFQMTENQIYGCHLEVFKRKDRMIVMCVILMYWLMILAKSEMHIGKYICKRFFLFIPFQKCLTLLDQASRGLVSISLFKSIRIWFKLDLSSNTFENVLRALCVYICKVTSLFIRII